MSNDRAFRKQKATAVSYRFNLTILKPPVTIRLILLTYLRLRDAGVEHSTKEIVG
jgi:hypothetical protein